MTDLREAKKQVRSELRASLAALSPQTIAHLSTQIVERLESLPEFAAAEHLLAFAQMSSRPEVDLRPLATLALRLGKALALPRTHWPTRTLTPCRVSNLDTDLEPDPGNAAAGLLQPGAHCLPIQPSKLGLLLIPGLGFDLAGGRIGHGAGFYDRFLAQPDVASGPGLICGVGFEAQLLPPGHFMPREPHDRPLHALVTESRVLRFAPTPAKPD